MLTKENKAGLAKLLDDLIVFKNPFLEAIDGPTLKAVIGLLDTQLFEKIPSDLWEDINQSIAAILKKDYETAATEVGELIGKIFAEYVLPKNVIE